MTLPLTGDAPSTGSRSSTRSPSKPTGSRGSLAVPTGVQVGDAVRIERRYVVDGSLTSVEDSGTFRGVQLVGSSEHMVLEQGRKRTVRMIPLHTISEITLEKRATKRARAAAATRGAAFDPSVA